jgi:hypothetical protein
MLGEDGRVDVPEPTWEMLRGQMSRPRLPAAWRTVGVWCIDTVAAVLGPDWPVEAWKRGELPGFIAMPWAHRQAMLEFVEFALRMQILAEAPGAAPVRKECRTDRRRARAAGTQLQLEVAGLALGAGAAIKLESRVGGGYPADVVIDHHKALLVVECAVVQVPDVDRQFDEAFQYAGMALASLASGSTWDLTAEVSTTDLEGLREDLADLDLILAVSAPDLPVRFDRPWGHVLAVPGDGGLLSVRSTATGTDLGRHLAGKLRGKAEQAAGVDGVWLRADVRSGLWQGTAWSSEALEVKAQQLAGLVESALEGCAAVAGVVLTSGPCAINGDVDGHDVTLRPGLHALRRALPVGRVRETVVVALTEHAVGGADLWRDLYSAEAQWLPTALDAAGLPPLDAIFATAPPSTAG